MMCQDIQNVIETIGPNALPDDPSVTQHLAECDDCRLTLEAGRALDGVFRSPASHDVADATLDGLMARLDEAPDLGPEHAEAEARKPIWKRPKLVALAASVVGVALIGSLVNQFYGGGRYEIPVGSDGDRYVRLIPTSAPNMTGHANDDGRGRPVHMPTPAATRLHGKPMGTPMPRATGTPVTARPGNHRVVLTVPGYYDSNGDSGVDESGWWSGNTGQSSKFRDYGTNPTFVTKEEPVSTFAVDVDTASYTMARQYLMRNQMPPTGAIRVEELINAFDYAYDAPSKGPFSVSVEAFPSPNRIGYHVLHVGVKGKEIKRTSRKSANLVFVIDVSGSMGQPNRLGLVKQSLEMLVNELDERDSVGVVVYGTNARTVLEPTRATPSNRRQILAAIRALQTEGSTNAEAGLTEGYRMASTYFKKGAVNRVVLCSDGMANVGATTHGGILSKIEDYADKGITISTVGFGMGGYNDTLMEQLADKGDGNYAYVDRLDEAHRIFVQELTGTLQVIAKDVKIQMEFDPRAVERYRLLGFENRGLTTEQFDDDTVDAGEIGAGHDVTAIYEVKLAEGFGKSKSLGELRVRYKEPQGTKSTKMAKELPGWIVRDSYKDTSPPTQLSMVAAGFAEKLRGSYWARTLSYSDLLEMWGQIPEPLKSRKDVQELRTLILKAQSLDQSGDRFAELVPIDKMDFDHVPQL